MSDDVIFVSMTRKRPSVAAPDIVEIKAKKTKDNVEVPRFVLTKLQGEVDALNERLDLESLLSKKTISSMVQFNFMVSIDWFMSCLGKNRGAEILFVHGERDNANLHAEALKYKNLKLYSPPLPYPYGTHHTKAMILFYEDGTMQLVIHTANMIPQDWALKTQGAYISPMLSKKAKDQDTQCPFELDLISYLKAYGAVMDETIRNVKQYDFTPVKAALIASVPGKHFGDDLNKFGHLKVSKELAKHQKIMKHNGKTEIICQASSMGSLGPNPESWLCGQFLRSLSNSSNTLTNAQLKIVWPSVANVRNSLEGYAAGGSIPFDDMTYMKQKYVRDYMHLWCSKSQNRDRAMPHIKTYLQRNPETGRILWFLLTSANISKAAWGDYNAKSKHILIRSFELGVLYVPEDNDQVMVPYDLPLTKYRKTDEPWRFNLILDEPDMFGRTWPP
jgi:tyrosyl-DNA phosphodiesterase-1